MAVKEHFVSSFNSKAFGMTEVLTAFLDGLDDMVRDGHRRQKTSGQALIADVRKTSLETLALSITAWHRRKAQYYRIALQSAWTPAKRNLCPT